MSEPSWYSILPPVLAIVLALWSRQVILSLFAGIWIGFTLLNALNPLRGVAAAIDGIIDVFGDPSDARVLIFTLLVGSLITSIEESGGVRGFVGFLETRRWVHTGRRAQLMAWATGLVIFIESNITLLVAGAVSRPLFDRYRISREKLAYIIDSTSAPVCVMIPLNAWGAVIIGLIGTSGVSNPLEVFVASIPYNLYALVAIALSLVVIVVGGPDFGPMKAAEIRTRAGDVLWPKALPIVELVSGPPAAADGDDGPSAAYMVVPILTMIAMMPLGLYVTGDGDLIKGSGSTAIMWAVASALVVLWLMMLAKKKASIEQLMGWLMVGAGKLLPVSTILLFALALGDVAKAMGTGPYVAGIASAAVPAYLIAPLVFVVSSFIAFSVGSSWGTFAIMIPIAVPIAQSLGLPIPLLVGAAVSGAIFGDHASPISDTTVVASMAAATDHIDHVRTQLPYALLAAAIATVGFTALGMVSGTVAPG